MGNVIKLQRFLIKFIKFSFAIYFVYNKPNMVDACIGVEPRCELNYRGRGIEKTKLRINR